MCKRQLERFVLQYYFRLRDPYSAAGNLPGVWRLCDCPDGERVSLVNIRSRSISNSAQRLFVDQIPITGGPRRLRGLSLFKSQVSAFVLKSICTFRHSETSGLIAKMGNKLRWKVRKQTFLRLLRINV